MKMSTKPSCYKVVFSCFLFFTALIAPTSKSLALSLDMPPEYLTEKADLIIFGRVIDVKSERKIDTFGEESWSLANEKIVTYRTTESIFTIFQVELLRTYKRLIDDPALTIFSPGGKLLNGDYLWSLASVKLEEGECIIAFLYYNEMNKEWRFYGGSRGVFSLDQCDSAEDHNVPVSRNYKGHFVPRDDLPDDYRNSDAGLTAQELLDIIRKELKK